MFKINKYTKWYENLIKSRSCRKAPVDYTEIHHIIPKCLGGDDSKNNLISLTGREHYIAHLLLTKMHDSTKLKFALVMMQLITVNHIRYHVKSSKIFEYIKIQNSIASIHRNKNRKYNSGYVTARSPNGQVKRFGTLDDIPDGWTRGSPSTGKSINRDKKYITNIAGTSVKTIDANTAVPDGWTIGNINASKGALFNNIKGSKYYYDPITGTEGRFALQPEGWLTGRGVLWYNNGSVNKLFGRVQKDIPIGWKRGRIIKWKTHK